MASLPTAVVPVLSEIHLYGLKSPPSPAGIGPQETVPSSFNGSARKRNAADFRASRVGQDVLWVDARRLKVADFPIIRMGTVKSVYSANRS